MEGRGGGRAGGGVRWSGKDPELEQRSLVIIALHHRGMEQGSFSYLPPIPTVLASPRSTPTQNPFLNQLLPALDLLSKGRELGGISFPMVVYRTPGSKAHLPGITRMGAGDEDQSRNSGPPPPTLNRDPSLLGFTLKFYR